MKLVPDANKAEDCCHRVSYAYNNIPLNPAILLGHFPGSHFGIFISKISLEII